MKVVLAGGSGFLGKALSNELVARSHQVLVLSRRAATSPAAARAWTQPLTRAEWVPDGTAGDWKKLLDGADAVVNLAGESIASRRWTAAQRESIRDSRVLATRSVVDALNGVRRPPQVLLNASGQNFYGSRGDEPLTEEASPGDDFLARVCVEWEEEARKAETVARVVLLRSTLVLSAEAGALPRMLLPFKLFGGGPLGDGQQFMSWVHLDDWVAMTAWAAGNERVKGPLNVAAPTPVRNRDFAAALGRALHRPSWIPAPAFALRALVGEMADSLLLSSARVMPQVALSLGYSFRYPDLDAALKDLFTIA